MMLVFDKNALAREMKKNHITIKAMGDALGLSRSAFYRKRKGETEFTRRDMAIITDKLGLDSPMSIFFVEKVS